MLEYKRYQDELITFEEFTRPTAHEHGSGKYTCMDQKLIQQGQDKNVQSGGAISSITSGDVALMAYEEMSNVPPPASAMRKPCCEGL